MIHIEIEESNPKVSIIVPAYNAEKFIGHTLDCLSKQIFKDIEVIVVNDGSTDNTKSIIEKFFFDRKIRYIEKENGGTGSALNIGHKAARGKYMTWCSADNIYLPNFVYVLSTVLDQAKANGTHFVYSDFVFIDENNRKMKDVLHPIPQPKEDFVNGYDIGMSFMYTRELWEKVGDYWSDICEDFNWVVRAGEFTDFALVKQVLAGFRVHGSQISGNNRETEAAAANKCKELAAQMIIEGKYGKQYLDNFRPQLVEEPDAS